MLAAEPSLLLLPQSAPSGACCCDGEVEGVGGIVGGKHRRQGVVGTRSSEQCCWHSPVPWKRRIGEHCFWAPSPTPHPLLIHPLPVTGALTCRCRSGGCLHTASGSTALGWSTKPWPHPFSCQSPRCVAGRKGQGEAQDGCWHELQTPHLPRPPPIGPPCSPGLCLLRHRSLLRRRWEAGVCRRCSPGCIAGSTAQKHR